MKKKKEWWKNIPVSINNAYGDPFTDIQIMDTYDKMKMLYNDKVKMSLCTKAVPSKECYEILNNISRQGNMNKYLFLQYSLTGLNEGRYSFEEREKTIHKLYDMFGQITLMIRPIIPNRNDSIKNMERIIKVAADTGKKVIIGGLHNKNKRKILDERFKESVLELCDKYNVVYFNKTSCAAANQFQSKCWVHDLGKPRNLHILDLLQYSYVNSNNKIILKEATTGDLNFVRMVTGSEPYTEKIINNYNLLSFTSDGHMLECTSSWFSWSKNVPCKIVCDYCIIRKIDYLLENSIIGCHPKELENKKIQRIKIDNTSSVGSEVKNVTERRISYNNIRTIQECRAHM